MGFLLLVSREIKFDEFDKDGDRIGRRLTVPMVFHKTALDTVHTILVSSAMSLIVVVIATRGVHSMVFNIFTALSMALIFSALMIVAYRSSSKTVFYKVTRLVMLMVPISIFTSF